jgi:anaerobic selenocysteine-containing dehydrogenase
MINVIINEDLYDKKFVEEWTYGFDKLVPHVQKYTPEWAEKITGVKADVTRKIARMFATTRGASIFHGTCTQDQCANGSQNDRELAILQVLTGNINVPGGWVISPGSAQRHVAALPGQAPRSRGVPPLLRALGQDEPLRRHEHGPRERPLEDPGLHGRRREPPRHHARQ